MVSQRMEKLTQRWQREGEQIGIRKGEQIGIRKGELAVLCRQLERKFGKLPCEAVERLERADVDRLLEWSDRVLTAATLDGVFNDHEEPTPGRA